MNVTKFFGILLVIVSLGFVFLGGGCVLIVSFFVWAETGKIGVAGLYLLGIFAVGGLGAWLGLSLMGTEIEPPRGSDDWVPLSPETRKYQRTPSALPPEPKKPADPELKHAERIVALGLCILGAAYIFHVLVKPSPFVTGGLLGFVTVAGAWWFWQNRPKKPEKKNDDDGDSRDSL
jgi:hypothetical protein